MILINTDIGILCKNPNIIFVFKLTTFLQLSFLYRIITGFEIDFIFL